jgi:hypothetical protein
MFKVGYINVIHDEKIKAILGTILDNRRKNKLSGIVQEKESQWEM